MNGRELRDIYLRHAARLVRYSAGEAERLVTILDVANGDIKRLISRAKSIDTKKQLRSGRRGNKGNHETGERTVVRAGSA